MVYIINITYVIQLRYIMNYKRIEFILQGWVVYHSSHEGSL